MHTGTRGITRSGARGVLPVVFLLIVSAMSHGSPGRAAAAGECSGSPPEAVMTLPAPLDKWGQIACTPFGHVLQGRDNWVWIWPDGSGTVFVPSQLVMTNPQPLGNRSYFTDIDIMRVRGGEADKAYATFREGLDVKETSPDIYRADLTSVSGKVMRVYFFDYDTYAWGMSCPDNNCVQDSRFIILDRTREPLPRQPPI
jgi:hypothetical protein